MEVINLSMAKNYDNAYAEKVTIIKNWLQREGLHFMEMSTIDEQEMCKSSADLFHMFPKNSNCRMMK